MKKNNDTKDYSEQLEFLNSEQRAKKIVNQSSDFPVRHTGSYRHNKALETVITISSYFIYTITSIQLDYHIIFTTTFRYSWEIGSYHIDTS